MHGTFLFTLCYLMYEQRLKSVNVFSHFEYKLIDISIVNNIVFLSTLTRLYPSHFLNSSLFMLFFSHELTQGKSRKCPTQVYVEPTRRGTAKQQT